LPTKSSPLLLATVLAVLALALLTAPPAQSQSDAAALPDAPNPAAPTPAAANPAVDSTKGTLINTASPYDKYIDPGQPAPPLDFHDKFLLGVKDATSVISVGAWVVNAWYGQATNGKPHYGTNRQAFAQRFGAAAARDASEDIFAESILAPLLHEDPRYYILGPGPGSAHSLVHRFTYAITRALITRGDDGGRTINLSQIGGNLAGAALTQAYYPASDRGALTTLDIFAESEAGSALGFVVSEFFSSMYERVHLKVASQF